jgi:ribonuclease Z
MKKAPKPATLRVLGCGEAFDTGLGNNSCLLYDGKGGVPSKEKRFPTVLFDCGYEIPERLWALNKIYGELDGVYLTHLHADHAFGLVPLLVRFAEEGRSEPLGIFGPQGTGSYLHKLMDLGYPGMRARLPFDVEFCELKESDSVQWGGLRFQTARSTHSVLNLAIRVEGEGELEGLSFAVSGDGQLTPETRKLYDGVKVLFHETYSIEQDIPTHCDLKTLSKFAARSAIQHLGITHVSRGEKSAMKQAVSQLKRLDPRWFLLKPGMEILLPLRSAPRSAKESS